MKRMSLPLRRREFIMGGAALYIYLAFVTGSAFALARIRIWRWLAVIAIALSVHWTFPGVRLATADGLEAQLALSFMMQPVSIRYNNPGALNTAAWVREYPGYEGSDETTPGNDTARFRTPEQGVAAWWELLRRYGERNIRTVGHIVTEYGGGQDYTEYLKFMESTSGLPRNQVIALNNDELLLLFGKAMFHYEAGRPTPLTDAQMREGFRMGRAHAHGEFMEMKPGLLRCVWDFLK